MKASSKFSLIFALLHCYTVGILATDIETKDYPCPLDEEFSPCVCTENTEESTLDVDCTAAETEEQLSAAFKNSHFPFPNMNSLFIDHTNCNECSLDILKIDTFGPVSFRDVQIHGTALTTVVEGAFANSEEHLEVWDLSGNKINFFTFEVVEAFSVLETLNLSDNALNGTRPVPDISSTSLKNLNLSNNPEVVFGPNVVTNCPALEDLQLNNISLTQIPQIDQDLTSMFNGLTELRSLDLSNNKLPELLSYVIDPGTQSKLNYIYLSNNNIQILHPEFITNEGATGVLDMSNNLIELLEETVWEPIFHAMGKETINLQNNPLLCGCDLAWLVLDPELMLALDPATTCSDGLTLVVELPTAPYEDC